MVRPIAFACLPVIVSLLSSPAATQQFEVASIRPSPTSGESRTPIATDPGRVAYRSLSPKILIQLAYKSPEWKISGGPDWLDSDLYDVVATLPAGASVEQIPLMLQALLADRFHLALQRENRQITAYRLVVSKNGPKLRPGDQGDQWTEGTFKGGILPGRIELHQLTMGGLAEVLTSRAGRPVIDKTGLNGVFDISLKWTADDTASVDPNAQGPSLYTALEEQLGLKLESVKSAVEVLVVTHVEKPSEN